MYDVVMLQSIGWQMLLPPRSAREHWPTIGSETDKAVPASYYHLDGYRHIAPALPDRGSRASL